jgi:hypothetical protein
MRLAITISSALLSIGLLVPSCDTSTQAIQDLCVQPNSSHSVQWQGFSIGSFSPSVLRDVAIVNDSTFWVVGEFYLADSLGDQDLIGYNAALCVGTSYRPYRIQFTDIGGAKLPSPISSVIAFGDKSVWFASYGGLVEWNGAEFNERAVFATSLPFDGQVQELWGTSSTNIYAVGYHGAIYHYWGSGWDKLPQITQLPILDIWGGYNPRSKQTDIMAVASLQNVGRGIDLISIRENLAVQVDTLGLPVNARSVWFIPGATYYVAGDGLFVRNGFTYGSSWSEDPHQPLTYKEKVRGLHCRDVFVVGDLGLVSHYNGIDWHHYDTDKLALPKGLFYGVDATQSTVVVGYNLFKGRDFVRKTIDSPAPLPARTCRLTSRSTCARRFAGSS